MFHMQRQRKLPEEHARFYAAEVGLALNFLHEKVITRKLLQYIISITVWRVNFRELFIAI